MKTRPVAAGLAIGVGVVCLFAGGAVSRAQSPQTFRGGIERVTVDAVVVDSDGKPVTGLTPADFELRVDGKIRQVESADFVRFDAPTSTGAAPAPASGETFPEVTMNAGAGATPGRIVILVADAASFRPGQERPVIVAATNFLKQLSPGDRVGLLTLPAGTPSVEVTRDHDRVAKALASVVGQEEDRTGDVFVGLSEAMLITRGDGSTLSDVVDRECGKLRGGPPPPDCPASVQREATDVVSNTRVGNENRLRMLSRLIDSLSKIEGPKMVVLLSQGMATLGTMTQDFTAISRAAGRAAIAFYAIQMYQPWLGADASGGRPTFDFRADQQLGEQGLGDLVGVAGGTVIQPAGKVDTAFERVAREISSRYVLSFNVEPDDRTGKARAIDLKIPKQAGRLVRYRREFVWRAPDTSPAPTSPQTQLAAALASGESRAEIALAASTFTAPDPTPPGQRTTLWVRVGQAQDHPESSTLMFEVMDDKNVRVASTQSTLQAQTGEPLDFVAKMALPPGRYVLRLAARDPAGRLGTVEHPFEARLAAAGPPAVGSLLLLDARAMAAGKSTLVRVLGAQDAAFHAFVELQAPVSFDWTSVTGLLEVLDSKDGAVRFSLPMRLRETRDPERRGLEANVPVSGWTPGTYRVRATVTNGAAPLASPIRSVVLETPPPADPSAAPTASASETAAPATAAPTAAGGGAAEVVQRATTYLSQYLARGSSVVAEERYLQIMRPGPPPLSEQNVDEALEWRADNNDKQRDMRDAQRRRQLISDLLMVKTQDGIWTNYRDVGTVDGRTLGNRSKRALELFTESGGDLAGLRQVANESTRYNLMAIGNFNIPTLPLMVLQPEHADRFEFTRQGEAVIDNLSAIVITYRERKGPTFVRNRKGADIFLTGRLWLAADDGRVLRTEMMFTDRLSGWASQTIVAYGLVPSLGLLMPAEMWERHWRADNFRLPYIEGRARYTNFRRFAVSTSEDQKTPKD